MPLREPLRDILKGEDERVLRGWCWRACISWLGPSLKLAASIREHREGIVTFAQSRLTNGRIGG